MCIVYLQTILSLAKCVSYTYRPSYLWLNVYFIPTYHLIFSQMYIVYLQTIFYCQQYHLPDVYCINPLPSSNIGLSSSSLHLFVLCFYHLKYKKRLKSIFKAVVYYEGIKSFYNSFCKIYDL